MEKTFEIELSDVRPKVVALARKFCRASALEADPEDIAQDVLLRLWSSLKGGSPIQNIEAWAVTATKNACISEWRKSRKVIATKAFKANNPASDKLPEKAFNAADNASAKIEESEYQERARKILESFSAGTRKLLAMRTDGMSLDEIAAATGRSKGSVKTSISTARKQMLEALNQR